MRRYESDPYTIICTKQYIVVDISEGEDSVTYVLDKKNSKVSCFDIDNQDIPEEIIEIIEKEDIETFCLDETPQNVRELLEKHEIEIDFVNV